LIRDIVRRSERIAEGNEGVWRENEKVWRQMELEMKDLRDERRAQVRGSVAAIERLAGGPAGAAA
jgi:hypothetical protein